MVVLDGTGMAPPNDLLPEICVDDYILPRVSAAAWGALLKRNDANPHLFRYGGRLVRLNHDGSTPILQEVTRGVLRHELGRSARWCVERGHNKVPALPPFHVVDDMLAYPDQPLPHLDRVTQVPVFSPAGALISIPGFNAEAGIYYAPHVGTSIPEVPLNPSRSDVHRARSILMKDLLGDFPFTSEAERAHAIAAALLPFVRSMIHGATPLHLFEKPTPGTGAGLLASVLCYPALGGSPTIMTLGNSEDETRRTLTAKLGRVRSSCCSTTSTPWTQLRCRQPSRRQTCGPTVSSALRRSCLSRCGACGWPPGTTRHYRVRSRGESCGFVWTRGWRTLKNEKTSDTRTS